MKVSLDEQIEVISYAVGQASGDDLKARLDAVLTTLLWLKANRSWVISASPENPLRRA